MTYATRFAPSPTGPLHLGHAYSALIGYERALQIGGRFLLRIEDIDQQRSKPEWEVQIYEDLAWLGIKWESPVLRQSDRSARYQDVLQWLWQHKLIYPCHCSRKDIFNSASAPQEGDGLVFGPDGILYPGTCRDLTPMTDTVPKDVALRLNMRRALQKIGVEAVKFCENGSSETRETSAETLMSQVGDIVVSRKSFLGSYHLSVVLDDADQGISEVVRGKDLLDATVIHIVLQKILNLPSPEYYHHDLIRDAFGKRLAKRDDARAISKYRADGCTPDDIRRMVGLG